MNIYNLMSGEQHGSGYLLTPDGHCRGAGVSERISKKELKESKPQNGPNSEESKAPAPETDAMAWQDLHRDSEPAWEKRGSFLISFDGSGVSQQEPAGKREAGAWVGSRSVVPIP